MKLQDKIITNGNNHNSSTDPIGSALNSRGVNPGIKKFDMTTILLERNSKKPPGRSRSPGVNREYPYWNP